MGTHRDTFPSDDISPDRITWYGRIAAVRSRRPYVTRPSSPSALLRSGLEHGHQVVSLGLDDLLGSINPTCLGGRSLLVLLDESLPPSCAYFLRIMRWNSSKSMAPSPSRSYCCKAPPSDGSSFNKYCNSSMEIFPSPLRSKTRKAAQQASSCV